MTTLTCVLLALTAPAFAQQGPRDIDVELKTASAPYGVGVGIVLGDPTGVSVLWRADDTNAIQLGVGWSFVGSDLDVALDYQITFARVRMPEAPWMHLNAYVGPGVEVDFFNNGNGGFRLGARVPVGLAMLFEDEPFDVFLQVSPVLYLVPASAFDIDAGLGARVFF